MSLYFILFIVHSGEPAVLRFSALLFGTSGHRSRPPGLVTDSYTTRNLTVAWPQNPQHKMWFRPAAGYAILPSIHGVDVLRQDAFQARTRSRALARCVRDETCPISTG